MWNEEPDNWREYELELQEKLHELYATDFGRELPAIDEEWNEWWWENTYNRTVKELADDLGVTPCELTVYALHTAGAIREDNKAA